MKPVERPDTFGLVAEFDDVGALKEACVRVRAEGYTLLEAYAPYPVEGLAESIGFYSTLLPATVLAGGITGCIAGFGLQYWANLSAYPVNIAGRPLNSWPAFIPITFECTVLFAAVSAVLGMLAFNGLPQPYHPLFHIPAFARATQDRFFLLIASRDPRFLKSETRQFLEGLKPLTVHDVPH